MIDLIRSLRIPDVLFAFVIASAGASSALSAEVAGPSAILDPFQVRSPTGPLSVGNSAL